MTEVTKDVFYKTIGRLNVHPSVQGPYPYTSIFRTIDGIERGRVIDSEDGGTKKSRYLIVGKPSQ